VDVYPNFPRYSEVRPGRHNEIVWPMVEGFWALAAAHYHDESAFAHEVSNLAQLARSSSGIFYEIYNAQTGAPDGGWQTGSHWESQPDQTWSATAYLAMIYRGLYGMNFTPAGIEFQPLLPAGWGDVSLTGLQYRGMTLDIHLHGAGCAVRTFALDGKPQKQPFAPATLTGMHSVDITVRGGCER
jgi:glycogen debranching enzyme